MDSVTLFTRRLMADIGTEINIYFDIRVLITKSLFDTGQRGKISAFYYPTKNKRGSHHTFEEYNLWVPFKICTAMVYCRSYLVSRKTKVYLNYLLFSSVIFW